MTPSTQARKRDVGCLFCPYIADRGTVNHHLNTFIPILAKKLKSIPKLRVDDFHHVGIVTAARYDKQAATTRARIAPEDWEMPSLTECIVLAEFGKIAVVELARAKDLDTHEIRVRIPKTWWEGKVAEAVCHINNSCSFNLDRFITGVLAEAHDLWYPPPLGDYIKRRAAGHTNMDEDISILLSTRTKGSVKRARIATNKATTGNRNTSSSCPRKRFVRKTIHPDNVWVDDDEDVSIKSCLGRKLKRAASVMSDESVEDRKMVMRKMKMEHEGGGDKSLSDNEWVIKKKEEQD